MLGRCLVVVSYWISTSNHNSKKLQIWSYKLYLIEFLHQTTTTKAQLHPLLRLYLIEFLHQTTTKRSITRMVLCCILLNFYIKPQHSILSMSRSMSCILLNFYIKPQHSPCSFFSYFVVSYWISTSNHNSDLGNSASAALYLIEFLHQTTTFTQVKNNYSLLYLIEFLHQTTTAFRGSYSWLSCILLNFYIKPQHSPCSFFSYFVVSYWISTSNHNGKSANLSKHFVVSYWISTSNHNAQSVDADIILLYLIEFLHQTTTFEIWRRCKRALYLIEFLHQTTTSLKWIALSCRCILLNFYIKPQRRFEISYLLWVVSYWISTSNHNLSQVNSPFVSLYLIEFLHQTTTPRCILRCWL